MQHGVLGVLLGIGLLGLAGCDSLEGEEPDRSLTFENASRSVVTVYPLTTEWGAFSMVPMQVVKMDDIRDTDFRYEPHLKVQEGSASTERYVIFVDAPPLEK